MTWKNKKDILGKTLNEVPFRAIPDIDKESGKQNKDFLGQPAFKVDSVPFGVVYRRDYNGSKFRIHASRIGYIWGEGNDKRSENLEFKAFTMSEDRGVENARKSYTIPAELIPDLERAIHEFKKTQGKEVGFILKEK